MQDELEMKIDSQRNAAMESGGPRIFLIRGHKVMLDEDLAALNQLETGALKHAVSRNLECFTDDFAFKLNPDEFADLKSEFANSDREAPYVFTGQGLALLSSILLDEQENRKNREFCAPTCGCRK